MSTSSVTAVPDSVEIRAPITPEYADVLTPDALSFVGTLERAFRETREALLRARAGVRPRSTAASRSTSCPRRGDSRGRVDRRADPGGSE